MTDVLHKNMDDMVQELFSMMSISLDQATELQRQILAAFAFGLIYSAAQENELNVSEAQVLAVTVFQNSLQYEAEEAEEFVELLIEASSDSEVSPGITALIFQGIDGYTAWVSGSRSELKVELQQTLTIAAAAA